jgi:hypothetical protein
VYRERLQSIESRPSFWLSGGLTVAGAAFALCCIAISVLVWSDEQVLNFIALLFVAGGVGSLWYLARRWLSPEMPWMQVTPEGLVTKSIAFAPEQLRWADLQSRGELPADVSLRLPVYRSPEPTRLAVPTAAGHVEVSFALPRHFKCFRFANAFALRRAVLLQLASLDHTRLVFDPTVFDTARIDPHTWRPLRGPSMLFWVLFIAALAAAGYVSIVLVAQDVEPLWIMGIALICGPASFALAAWGVSVHYPSLKHPIVFELPATRSTP